MNSFSKSLCFALIGAAVLLAGCPKKPRPDPSQTMPTGGETTNVTPESVNVPSAAPTGLQERPPGGWTEAQLDRTILAPVYFDFDRSAIKQGERPKLEKAAKWIADNKGRKLVLEGHCDWRGTKEYNMGLGDRRANAVKEYLQKLGADVTVLETLSKGDLEAKEHGTEAEMSKDRRVELVVVKQ